MMDLHLRCRMVAAGKPGVAELRKILFGELQIDDAHKEARAANYKLVSSFGTAGARRLVEVYQSKIEDLQRLLDRDNAALAKIAPKREFSLAEAHKQLRREARAKECKPCL